MKSVFRKLLALSLSLFFLLIAFPRAYATDCHRPVPAVYASSNEKTAFAKNMEKLYAHDLEDDRILPTDRAEIDRLMEEAVFAQGEKLDAIQSSLANYGVYMLKPSAVLDNSNIYLSAPMIYFDAQEYTWTVSCSGYWRNDNWDTTFLPGEIGGCDAFGVGFTNCTNEFTGTVIRSYAFLKDQTGTNTITISNCVEGDVSDGFGFEMQDYSIAGSLTSPRAYVGYYWYGSCTFSADFASMGGIATAYYVHTYDTAAITEIHFGISLRPGGVKFLITDQTASFIAYSSDTRIRTS